MKQIIYLFVVLPFLSCNITEESPLKDKTILVYMVADNNLDPFAPDDINEMESVWNKDINGNLLVYLDRAQSSSPSHPCLFQITSDSGTKVVSPVVKIFREQNSSDKEVIHSVLSYVTKMYPASSYGLIFWSHGTGWIPKEEPVRSFSDDRGQSINIDELARALPIQYEFIIFDACYMGAVEVAYELKDKTETLFLSSSEVLSSGYPYEKITPLLFQIPLPRNEIAWEYYRHYQDQKDIYSQSATISVIKTREMEKLAVKMREIIVKTPGFLSMDDSLLQEYALNQELSGLFYDLGHTVYQAYEEGIISEDLKNEFIQQLNKTVVYKKSTTRFFEILPLDHFSGLSIYLYNKQNTYYNQYYRQLKWYKECGYEALVSY